MKNYIVLITVITFVALLLSCNNSKKATMAETTATADGGSEMLYRFQWNLTEINGIAVPSNAKAFLLVSQGQPNKVGGNTGCNLMSGSVELSGASGIKFSPFATTKRACIENGIANMEQQFLDALETSTNWAIKDTVLLLSRQNTIVAKLKGTTTGNN